MQQNKGKGACPVPLPRVPIFPDATSTTSPFTLNLNTGVVPPFPSKARCEALKDAGTDHSLIKTPEDADDYARCHGVHVYPGDDMTCEQLEGPEALVDMQAVCEFAWCHGLNLGPQCSKRQLRTTVRLPPEPPPIPRTPVKVITLH